ncbi:S8 family serine peptidase [Nocardioides limicola]|uniref:S8 family serine peptidase n=1 Tax=Nocardioides limicola TaxID=2803368 RepID=UPI00193B3B08|nr:S8 family serine peptidase [Nocardioides sp. DJM-14]
MRRIGVLTALVAALLSPPAAASADGPAQDPSLHLVTLTGAGTAAITDPRRRAAARAQFLDQQDSTLQAVQAPDPVYRWTSALNGYAVDLTPDQVSTLEAMPQVALVEANTIRPMADRSSRPAAAMASAARRGGAGVVIGFVDSGLAPAGPVFAATPGLGRAPEAFIGPCTPGEQWTRETCTDKVVGARWFVTGFGTENLSSVATLSAHDDHGHGTQVASIAAGNSRVPVILGGETHGRFAGTAPQARIAVYKACWTAPDPDDDGCATADLVTAIDRATDDQVDVLNLSLAGSNGFDTVERALLGAAEADVVVVASAGNDPAEYAAHASPWVTTVGATTAGSARGAVQLPAGIRLTGAMAARTPTGTRPLVLARDVGTADAAPTSAARCLPGTLDAKQVKGAIVICQRGGSGRVDKSRAVARADGVGMVLTNSGPGAVAPDLHAVPTVHLSHRASQRLLDAVARRGQARARLVPLPATTEPSVPDWSAPGDPRGGVIKPDLVAPGAGVLSTLPARPGTGPQWEYLTGTSASAAGVSGAAAVLRSRHPDRSAVAIRSMLSGAAEPISGESPLTGGAGAAARGADTDLVFEVGPRDYRRYLAGRLGPDELNTGSLLLDARRGTATRSVTNLGSTPMYYSVTVEGLRSHEAQVRPLAVHLQPGETHHFEITVTRTSGGLALDHGAVVWRGANGDRLRLPLAITR